MHISFCFGKGQIFSETDIITMLEFLVDSIFTMFGERVFNRQSAFLWVTSYRRLVPLFM